VPKMMRRDFGAEPGFRRGFIRSQPSIQTAAFVGCSPFVGKTTRGSSLESPYETQV
jgi:hypothetical protein